MNGRAAFSKRVFENLFVEDRDISDLVNIEHWLAQAALPANQILKSAVSDQGKTALKTRVGTAVKRKVFGAPTFFANDVLFWGDDRLEQAIYHLTHR